MIFFRKKMSLFHAKLVILQAEFGKKEKTKNKKQKNTY